MRTWAVIVLLILAAVATDSAKSVAKIRQKRGWIIDSFEVEEENPGPYPYEVGRIQLDVKYLVQFHIHGEGVELEPVDLLTIDKRDGILWMKRKVDYEKHRLLKLKFEAKNVSNDEVDTRLGMEIQIKDVNDNVPKLDKNYEVWLDESTQQGKDVVTVKADDLDDSKTENGTFDLRIVSVTPKDPDVDFVIQQSGAIGKISFKGCLHYEKFQKYTVLVEAKDRGSAVQLSSTGTVVVNINDKNNHPPVYISTTGSGKIKEGESGVSVLRLKVSDEDTIGTPAWKVKYMLHGDTGGNFQITTDPETNEGILTVVKPLDYEDGAQRNLSFSMENEEPYFSCKVKSRPQQGLWDVEWIQGHSGTGAPVNSLPLSINVEDINDPPMFLPEVKNVRVMENSPIGTALEKFIAKDRDGIHASSFDYEVGTDPAGWVTVDSKTGQVSTKQILDRESSYVNDSVYTALILAVDHGQPPMTGTGTLSIYLIDENDNVPVLDANALSMCLSDKSSSTSISAHDLDLVPYSEPYHFELLGDVKGKWTLDSNYGTKVNLVRGTDVYAGHHQLTLRISDTQGHNSLQNLTVTVCDCTESPNCHSMSASSQLGGNAIGIIILGLLLLLALLLLASLITCGREKVFIKTDESPGWHLLPSNIEKPGTDCKIPFVGNELDMINTTAVKNTQNSTIIKQEMQTKQNSGHEFSQIGNGIGMENSLNQQFKTQRMSSTRTSFREVGYDEFSTRKSFRGLGYAEVRSQGSLLSRVNSNRESSFMRREFLNSQLIQKLNMLENPQEELGDYDPHEYAYEGEPVADPQLDAISIPGSDSDGNFLQNLHPKFRTLASICRPDLI